MKTTNTENLNGKKEDNKNAPEDSGVFFNASEMDEVIENIEPLDIGGMEEEAEKYVKEVKEKAKERTPKTKKKTVDAKKAEDTELLIKVAKKFFDGVHEIALDKLGDEFKHEDEELTVISALTVAVIEKHFDLSVLEHKEELALGTYIFGTELPKFQAWKDRKLKEQKRNKNEG